MGTDNFSDLAFILSVILNCGPVLSFSSLELLQFAFSTVQKAEISIEENEICKSWVHVTSTAEEFFLEQLLDPSVHTAAEDTVMRIHTHLIHMVPPKTFARGGDANEDSDFLFDKMFTSDELSNSYSKRLIKYSRPCSVVFIPSLNHLGALTKSIVLSRLVFPHEDYFFFVQPSITPMKQFFREIRYKYFILDLNSSGYSLLDVCGFSGNFENIILKTTIFSRQCNEVLREKHFVVRSVRGTPWLRFRNQPDGSLQFGDGIYYRLLADSAQLFNFTFQLDYANSGGSSGFLRDGNWYGAVGEVYHRSADIALGCGITADRDTVIDMGIPFEQVSRTFFIKASSSTLNWKSIFAPFQRSLWALVGLTAFVIAPLFYFSITFIYWRDHGHPGSISILNSVVSSLLSILLEQETGQRSWIGLRIKSIVLLWMFFCLVIGAGYRSRLIFFLTFKVPGDLPTTHAALVDENYKLFFRYYGGVAYKNALDSNDSTKLEVVRRAVLVNSSQECIVSAIMEDNSACLDWDEHGTYASYTNATFHLRQSKNLIIQARDYMMDGLWVAWIYRNMSPLIQTFDSYILATFASGLYNKWVAEDWTKSKLDGARWLNENRDLPSNRKILDTFIEFESSVKALTLSSLYGLFGLLLSISILSLLVFFAEVFVLPRFC